MRQQLLLLRNENEVLRAQCRFQTDSLQRELDTALLELRQSKEVNARLITAQSLPRGDAGEVLRLRAEMGVATKRHAHEIALLQGSRVPFNTFCSVYVEQLIWRTHERVLAKQKNS